MSPRSLFKRSILTLGVAFLSLSDVALAQAQTQAGSDSTLLYISPQNILRFAEWLYWSEKDYPRSATEYSRYIFFSPSALSDTVIFRRSMATKLSGRYAIAVSLFQESLQKISTPQWRLRAKFNLAHTYFLMGDYERSLNLATTGLSEADVSNYGRSIRLLALSQLMLGDWKSAAATIDSGNASNAVPPAYSDLVRMRRELPHKSALLSSILSAVIPGAGKMYTSEWVDGVYSLALVGTCAWLSIDGFRNAGTRSVKGWVFGGIGSLLYAGNIFGAAQSAQRFNEGALTKYQSQIREEGVNLGVQE